MFPCPPSVRFLVALAVVGAWGGLCGGCGLAKRLSAVGSTVAATEKAPRGTPSVDELELGEIAFVRGTGQPFVLIKMVEETPLPERAELQTRPVGDRAPARLRLSSERRGRFRTADILSGQPRLGERVVLLYPKGDASDPVEDVMAPEGGGEGEGGGLPTPDAGAEDARLQEPASASAPEAASGPIRFGERVEVRTSLAGDEAPEAHDLPGGSRDAEEVDASLPLPSRGRLPGEAVPFMETLETEGEDGE